MKINWERVSVLIWLVGFWASLFAPFYCVITVSAWLALIAVVFFSFIPMLTVMILINMPKDEYNGIIDSNGMVIKGNTNGTSSCAEDIDGECGDDQKPNCCKVSGSCEGGM
jgi:hypothetical protein